MKSFDEVLERIKECYEGFAFVLKMGNPAEKRRALYEIDLLQSQIKTYVEEFSQKNGVDFGRLMYLLSFPGQEEIFVKAHPEAGEAYTKSKEVFSVLHDEVQPLVDKFNKEVQPPPSAKQRKRKMESRIRSKE